MTMPQCGCRTGCHHRDHPGLTPQRRCRLGYAPQATVPTTIVTTTPEQRARADWGRWRHLRRSVREDAW